MYSPNLSIRSVIMPYIMDPFSKVCCQTSYHAVYYEFSEICDQISCHELPRNLLVVFILRKNCKANNQKSYSSFRLSSLSLSWYVLSQFVCVEMLMCVSRSVPCVWQGGSCQVSVLDVSSCSNVCVLIAVVWWAECVESVFLYQFLADDSWCQVGVPNANFRRYLSLSHHVSLCRTSRFSCPDPTPPRSMNLIDSNDRDLLPVFQSQNWNWIWHRVPSNLDGPCQITTHVPGLSLHV